MPLSPIEAWQTLPLDEWNETSARHLLRRTGWSATSAMVQKALSAGLEQTLNKLFPPTAASFAEPKAIGNIRDTAAESAKAFRQATEPDRRRLRRERREIFRKAQMELTLDWLQFALKPDMSAQEKWAFFLSDVYVVAVAKVRNPAMIYDHLATLRTHAFGPAPVLTKAVSRSPAMIEYLDLQQSRREAPNENFARELFELFVLGEGHYSEADIKNAARAFTGYRQRNDGFFYQTRQHDDSRKTVFGHSGNFTGDEVIDLAYREPAAARFLPAEMARFYLSNEPLPNESLDHLADWWRDTGFDLRRLLHRFFSSRLFFSQAYRANYIKSPVQFYLGLLQDLQLDVTPLPRATLRPLQQMGQTPFNPPNVRGWVGGRTWINSVTLAARRQMVQNLFTPIPVDRLNADELAILKAVKMRGQGHFTASPSDLAQRFPSDNASETAERLTANFLPESPGREFLQIVTDGLVEHDSHTVTPERLARVLETLLQSPNYQLC